MTPVLHARIAPLGGTATGIALILALALGYGIGTADIVPQMPRDYQHAPDGLPDWHGNVKSAQP
ncbi:hypothetical protein N6L24_09825 [Cognatishimia sp. SS12]|uniref:hypothetical protein n=1 Tax=Cognatishimia sp. SS12 TaxID=2979465 RepID=UPI00232B74EC|nr:hypothetical protein [Cognatishimia sp. SS12]MDC0738579.1 hypothetical protein [Cognatishimia sp. SS12]